jgi:arylsulfatase
MVEHDMHIGKFLDKLDELGIADNTIVFYSTDNGPHMNTWPDAAMTPRWPGHIEAGTWSTEIMHHMDWLPTFLAVAGESDVKEKLLDGHRAIGRNYKVHLDGYNFLPYLTGEEESGPRNEIFYFTDDGELSALRYQDWKVLFLEQRAEATFPS